MKVIPVIDILNGRVVHAVKGQRSSYQPLESILFKSSEPLEVAKGFKTLGFTDLYVADLDAIIDCSADFAVFRSIVQETGLNLMVDAGITNLERAQELFANGASKLIVGTETLESKEFVAQAVKVFGNDRVIVSLDLKGNQVLAKSGFDGCEDAICLLKDFKQMGLSQVIVLDLLRVGSGAGINMGFLKRIIDEVGLDVYVGGGVRNIDDLLSMKSLGLKGALVATSLHSGKLEVETLKREGLL